MVLQALRPIVLVICILSPYLIASDLRKNESTECVTTTSLSFTEREACALTSMSKSLMKINMNNALLLSGSTNKIIKEEAKYGQNRTSAYSFLGKMDKAKALLLEKISYNIANSEELIVNNASSILLYSEMQKTIIENQIVANDLLLKENRKK